MNSRYKKVFVLVLFIFFIGNSFVYATPRFQPGETLNPSCLPTDSDCAVVPPVTASTNTGGSVLFNTPVYVPGVTYQHPRDPAEIDGNMANGYSASFVTYGMYELMSSDTSVSSIKANVWNTNTSRDVTLKVFARPTSLDFNPDSVTPLYSGTINHASMPHASVSGGTLFNLTSTVVVPANQYMFVFWQSTTASEIHIAYFNTNAQTTPLRHGFLFGNANSNFFFGGTNFYAATFRVYANTDSTRVIVPTAGNTEFFTNPGFETLGTGGTALWLGQEISNSATGVVDEHIIVHSGTHAAKLTSGAANWYTPQVIHQMTVTPGQKYQLSFWTRGDGTNAGKYAIYDLSNSSYLNSTAQGLTTGITGTTYTQVTTSFTAPAGCNSIIFYFLSANILNAVTYFDDLSLRTLTDVVTLVPVSTQTLLNNLPSSSVIFSDPNGIMTSTNVRDAIIESYNKAASGGGSPTLVALVSPRIVLPDNLYAVVGDKLQLFFRGIIEAQNPYALPYTITSTVGNAYPRYFEYTPVIGDVGNKTLTFKVLNYDYSVLTTKTVNLKVVNHTTQPASNKNILIVGDSLTQAAVWPQEFYRRLTQTGGTPTGLGYGNITFIGDTAMSSYPTQAYTGYGGWSYGAYNGTIGSTSGHVLTGTFNKDKTDVGSYWLDGNGNTVQIEYAVGGLKVHGSGTFPASGTLTHVSGATHTTNIVYTAATNEPESPFWDSGLNRISFTSWASRNSYSTIDAAYVLLGWNSTSGTNVSDYTSYINEAKVFLDRFHTDYPSSIVRLVGVQIPSINGGLGNNYGANGGLSEYYGMLRSMNYMNEAYQNLANNPTYSSWVSFVATAPEFDSENNMPQTLNPVNSRNAATEYRGINGVHPDTTGYLQMADTVFREFVSTFTSN